MNQFVVPQFIDVEDKIFGPITTRQFLILLSTALFLFIIFKLADFTLFVFSLVVIGGLAVVFAFGKVNGQQFHYFTLNLMESNLRKPKLRLWHKEYSKKELQQLIKMSAVEEIPEKPVEKKEAKRRIRDLSLVVNTGGYYKMEE